VRGLEGAPYGELAPDLVERGDALAGLQRARMDALVGDQLLDGDLGLAEGEVGGLLVADLPGEDVIVVPALAVGALGLVLDVLAQHRRIRGHRLERVDEDRQRLVLDLDELDRVGRDVALLGDDEGDLLVLEQHLLLGEHRLHVAGERRHVVQIEGFEIRRGEHRDDAGQRLGLGGVDLPDAGVAVGRAHEVAVQQAERLHVVHVVALALDEADILDALALAAHALEAVGALGGGRRGDLVHSAASRSGTPLILAAAH